MDAVGCQCVDTDKNNANGAEDCGDGVVATDGSPKDQGTTDWCLAGMLAVTAGNCLREVGTKKFDQHECTQKECCMPAPAGSLSGVVTLDTDYAALGDLGSEGAPELHISTAARSRSVIEKL
jgi:hypothetical protein